MPKKKKKKAARKNTYAGFMLHSDEELQTWVARVEDVCEELDELLVDAGEKRLRVDLASLGRLERFLLARYRTVDAALGLEARGVIDAASRHVGRTLMLGTRGSKWTLNLDKPRDVYHRFPSLRFRDGTNESPVMIVTASLDRRTGTYMRDLVAMLMEDYG